VIVQRCETRPKKVSEVHGPLIVHGHLLSKDGIFLCHRYKGYSIVTFIGLVKVNSNDTLSEIKKKQFTVSLSVAHCPLVATLAVLVAVGPSSTNWS
jgi:hypothetical protein